MKSIMYRAGFAYQLVENYTVETGIIPPKPISTTFLELTATGLFTARRGYAWDGPSGPTFDRLRLLPKRLREWLYNCFMRGSLVHDGFYQFMRRGDLPRTYRKAADKLLRQHCIKDGMAEIRAKWVYKGVRAGAQKSSEAEQIKEIFVAPKPKHRRKDHV